MTTTQQDRLGSLASGVAIKAPCRAASTAALVLGGEQTIDGVACVSGDRVLVKNQAATEDNGIYVVDTGSWERDTDFDGNNDIVRGTLVYVTDGTANSGSYWSVASANPITIGGSAITFTATNPVNSLTGTSLALTNGTQGPMISMRKTTTDANYIEFSKDAYTAKASVGMLGNPEANLSFNMDYATGVHRFYDNTKDAIWIGMDETQFALQYAPAYAGAGDVWTHGGNLYNMQVAHATGNLTLRGGAVIPGTVTLNCSTPIGTEKVSIQSNLAANTTLLRCEALNTGSTADHIVSKSRTASGTGFTLFLGANNGGVCFYVIGNGNVVNTNNSYGAISARKLKNDDIATADASAIAAKFDRYRFVKYSLKADENKVRMLGVIADELEVVSPGLVEHVQDREEIEVDEHYGEVVDTKMLDAKGRKITRVEARTRKVVKERKLDTTTGTVKYSVLALEAHVALQETRKQLAQLTKRFEDYIASHP